MTLRHHTRPLLLDGAMGTMIQQQGLSEALFHGSRFARIAAPFMGNHDVLNITAPEVIRNIHRRYLEAGADIITTNTFSSQRISQAPYRLADHAAEMNYQGAAIARRVADEATATTGIERYVAGSVGPTTHLLSRPKAGSENITYDVMVDAYREQMETLIEGGVDALLIETVVDMMNARAALHAAHQAIEAKGRDVDVMFSMSVTGSDGHILTGQSVAEVVAEIADRPLLSIGINCSMGAETMETPLRLLAGTKVRSVRDFRGHRGVPPSRETSNFRVSVHPNAGLPDATGGYATTPERMAEILRGYIMEGLVDIIGGCCGTTPAHIAALRRMLDSL